MTIQLDAMQTLCQKHLAHAVRLLRMQIVCVCVGIWLRVEYI